MATSAEPTEKGLPLEQEGWSVEIADAQKVKGLAPLACKRELRPPVVAQYVAAESMHFRQSPPVAAPPARYSAWRPP
jgi:hypothetical protein